MNRFTEPLYPGKYYHIYNRGNNREILFFEELNYPYFLKLYANHIEPIADTFCYCLLKNHFHFLIRIKTNDEYREYLRVSKFNDREEYKGKEKSINPSQGFSNLFNAYAKAINKRYQRTGSLFEESDLGQRLDFDIILLLFLHPLCGYSRN